jgi:putative ubiquitin-RnfH superfamily antitoxin RatB of RatAB toxin-antitoxin module
VSASSATGTARKRCTVAFATRERQYLWSIELPAAACIAEALAAARALAASAQLAAEIPWDSASVGVFGELRSRSDGCEDGDRIELYRPLERDPRERRRERVQRERRGAKRAGSS